MSASPIYIQRDGKTEGPYDYAKLYSMIGFEEIEEDTLSQTEGMTGWRSIPETRIWSDAKLLKFAFAEAFGIVTRMAANEMDERRARTQIRQVLMQKNCLVDMATADSLTTVLTVNRWLASHCVLNEKPSDYFPAKELFMLESQRFSRDWPAVWKNSGGKIYAGRMIARFDDPVWSAISDFGYPFPPFSFDTALWTKDVSIDEAEKLGVTDIARSISFPKVKSFKFVGI